VARGVCWDAAHFPPYIPPHSPSTTPEERRDGATSECRHGQLGCRHHAAPGSCQQRSTRGAVCQALHIIKLQGEHLPGAQRLSIEGHVARGEPCSLTAPNSVRIAGRTTGRWSQ